MGLRLALWVGPPITNSTVTWLRLLSPKQNKKYLVIFRTKMEDWKKNQNGSLFYQMALTLGLKTLSSSWDILPLVGISVSLTISIQKSGNGEKEWRKLWQNLQRLLQLGEWHWGEKTFRLYLKSLPLIWSRLNIYHVNSWFWKPILHMHIYWGYTKVCHSK